MKPRGIVVTNQMELTPDAFVFAGNVETDFYNQLLLYWDHIDYIRVNSTGPDLNSDSNLKVLIDQGILTETHIGFSHNMLIYNLEKPFPMSQPGQATTLDDLAGYIHLTAIAQIDATRRRNETNSAIWSMGQTNFQLERTVQNSDEKYLAEIELFNCLPIPAPGAGIQEVLDFKYRRNDELMNLRAALDGLYLEIIDSADTRRARDLAVGKLQRQLMDLHKAAKEAPFEKSLTALKVTLQCALGVAIGAAGGKEIAEFLNLSPLVGGLIGGLPPLITMERKKGAATQALDDGLKDFSYIYHARNELS